MTRYARLAALAVSLCLLFPAAAWAQKGKPSAPTIKLLDAGKGKKQKLRYQAKAGAKEKMQMDMDMTMGMSMGGQALVDMRAPTVRMTADLEVTEVTDEGNFKLVFRYTGFKVLDTPGVVPAMKTSMEQALAGMETVAGNALLTDRGVVLDGDFDTTQVANPQMQQLADSIEQSMQQLSAPLPVEAVGKGARWQVTTELENNGLTIQQVATYKLRELRKDGFVCDVTVAQSAKSQMLTGPNVPPNTKIELISMKGSGNGELDVALRRLTPTSKVEMTSDMKMRMEAGAQKQEMEMHMTMEMKFKPGR
ncbi:MAG: hypothetical protein Tsb0020_48010 [Haliangiales bacterium]